MENRGLRVNMNKTKVMISGECQKPMQKTDCLAVVLPLMVICLNHSECEVDVSVLVLAVA